MLFLYWIMFVVWKATFIENILHVKVSSVQEHQLIFPVLCESLYTVYPFDRFWKVFALSSRYTATSVVIWHVFVRRQTWSSWWNTWSSDRWVVWDTPPWTGCSCITPSASWYKCIDAITSFSCCPEKTKLTVAHVSTSCEAWCGGMLVGNLMLFLYYISQNTEAVKMSVNVTCWVTFSMWLYGMSLNSFVTCTHSCTM